MADGSIIIDARINKKGAEAELQALQAKAKSTAQQIAAVDKQLGGETKRRNTLRDDLEAARQKASETAAALEEVNARLDAGRKSKFGVTNTADEALSNKLAAQLNAQDAKAREIEADYRAQNSTVQTLQQRHTDLTAQLEREQQAAQAQGNRVANAERIRAAAEAAGALAEKLTRAALTSGTLQKALHTVGTVGQKAFAWVGGKAQAVRDRITQAAQSAAQFRSRVARLVSGALVFNVLSSGLRTLTSWMGTALLSSSQLRAALGNLQGAASTAAAPLLSVLVPALTALANAAAMVFSYIARLVAFFTGKTISASASAAKAMGGVGKAAGGTAKKVKDANGELAAFDELNVLNKKSDEDNGGSGGGGGSAGDIVPDYDFTAESPFLDSILDAGLAAGLTQAIAEIQWDTLGRALTDGMRAAIMTLYNFTMTFTGWTDLGNGIAACLNAAINNIPWQEAAVGMSKLVIGLLNTLIAAVQGTDWTTFGQNVVGMIGSLDWAGLFAALSTLSVAVLTAINDILGQVDWAAVGTTLVGCLQAIDWAGLLTQAGTFIANSWPVMLAALAASLLPQLGAFILGTVLPSLVGHLVTLGATLLGQAVTWLTGTLLPAIMSGLSALITAIVGAIGLWPAVLLAVLAVLAAAIIAYLVTHWEEIKQKFSETCEILTEKMRSAGENLKAIWNAFWLTIKLIGMQIWENITTAWSNFWQGLHRLLNSAGAALQSAWSSAWTALGNTVKKIWDGIVGTIKTAVNSVISLVNGMISAVVGGVNAVIGVLNGFSFDVPEFAQGALGTAKIGFNIDPITAPQIPYLAQGAVIPANHEFLAVLGDQTNGTNVEAPLETIQEALAEVLAAQGGQEITIRFAGDLAQLVRLLNPYIDKENNRRGARLVSGGVY